MMLLTAGTRKAIPCCVLVLLGSALNANAQRGAITLPRNLVELTERASTVVHGRVTYARVESHPYYHNLRSVVVTLLVEDVLKGASDSTLTFRQFIWDPRDLFDRAGYREGDDLVLFLNPTTAAGFRSPVGSGQGRFRVVRDASGESMVMNEASNNGLFERMPTLSAAPGLSPKARRVLAQAGTQAGPMPLSVLRETVHLLATTNRGAE